MIFSVKMNLDNYDLFYMLMGETNWKSALVLVWNKFNYGLTLNKNPENKLNQFSYMYNIPWRKM